MMAELAKLSDNFATEMALMNAMEAAQLPKALDQDARDLVRLIQEHGKDYAETSNGDMTIPLMRALNRLVQAAKGAA